jgi:hypothetical protein
LADQDFCSGSKPPHLAGKITLEASQLDRSVLDRV